MRGELTPLYVVLLEPEQEAAAVARRLAETSGARALVAPVRGLGFFASAAAQAAVDAWWRDNVRVEEMPIVVVRHHEDLPGWIRGLDGWFVVVAADPADAAYRALPSVIVVSGDDPATIAGAVSHIGGPRGAANDATLPHAVVRDAAFADAAHLDTPGWPAAHPPSTTAPFDLLAAALAESPAARVAFPSPAPEAAPVRTITGGGPTRSPLTLLRRRQTGTSLANLTSLLVARSPIIAAIGSRKGGVGKTSHAAGVAIAAGEALDAAGRQAAIVDANLANPDAWGHMSLPPEAATVRHVVAALATNATVPRPVFAATRALACYPEERAGGDYTRTDIRRLAQYLRKRYAFTVIDMSNRLPDTTGGPEAAAAAFWLEEADVLLLPTGSSKQEFNGVLDYLDVRDLPPSVVAYIEPKSRRNRDHPLTQRYVQAMAARSSAVVTIPDAAEQVRYAVLEGVPVQDVSPALRDAYRKLTATLASCSRPAVSH